MTLNKADDIAKLDWKGNHFSDHHLFNKCHQFIVERWGSGDAREAKRAAYLTALHGMGIAAEVTDAEMIATFGEMG
jgi:hypothetical protein